MIPTLSVVIPVYQNASTLNELVALLQDATETIAGKTEIVCVVDGSPDNSLQVLQGLASRGAPLCIVEHRENRGQNAAVLTGLRAATGGVIAVMDADLQDRPEALPALVAEMERSGAEVVFGARAGAYESRLRLLTSRLYKSLLRATTALPPHSGLFLVMRRRVAERLISLGDVPSVVAAIGFVEARCVAIPVRRAPAATSSYRSVDRLTLGMRTLAWAAWKRLRGRTTS